VRISRPSVARSWLPWAGASTASTPPPARKIRYRARSSTARSDGPDSLADPHPLQAWYKLSKVLDVCAGQHGSVSQYYDI
jgi:hypothetical protein